MSQLGMLAAAPPRAVFSDCGLYRYALWREWVPEPKRRCLFIMLNPSTADSEQDDPTIRRCIAFAQRWGYDALDVANMFAFRTPYPSELWQAEDPVGPDNDSWIRSLGDVAECIVVAWGNNGNTDREDHILGTLLERREVFCLGTTGQGSPMHPLYRPADTVIEPYWKALDHA